MKNEQSKTLLPIDSKEDYLSVFKEVYYHLYTNSNVSRAEVLIEDLSNILLFCMSVPSSGHSSFKKDEISEYLSAEFKNPVKPFVLEDESIDYILRKFEAIDVKTAPAHVIGDAFQSLVGPNLRGDKGQFFTPKSVVMSMVEVLNPKDTDTICDPACGTGGFLIESLSRIANSGHPFKGKLIGIEKDEFLSNTATAILEIHTKSNFQLFNSNSLEISQTEIKSLLGTIDVILTNPPFGSKIGIKDKDILKQFDFGHSWTYIKGEDKWIKSNQVLKEQSPQLLFLELCFKLLKQGGKAGIVLPEGIFGNKSLGYVWDYIRSNAQIIGMIDCPRTLFQPSTDVKTNILFFEKRASSDQTFKVAIAKNCGHNKRGNFSTNKGEKIQDDFTLIGHSFNNGKTLWKNAVIKDKYYLVPRYCIAENNWSAALNSDFRTSKTITFKELIENKHLVVKKGNEVGSDAYGSGTIPFVRTSDLFNLEINYDPTKSISEDFYSRYKDIQNISENDILMVADGRYRIGKTSMILGGMTKCVVQSHLKIIRVLDDSIYTPFELLYLFNQKPILDQIKSLIFIQSTLGSIGNRLNELILPIPERDQEWIAKITDFKETLIERNRLLHKLNNTILEDED